MDNDSKDKERKNFPKELKRIIKSLDEIILPDIYKVPSDLETADIARRNYFKLEDMGCSYASIYDEYNRIADPSIEQHHSEKPNISSKQEEESKLPTKIKEEKLTLSLSRNSLEEYRRKYGLDKLRDKLMDSLVELASFKEGLFYLSEYINNLQENKSKYKYKSLRSDLPNFEKYFDEKDTNYKEKLLISEHYPDINADEVSWFSLLKSPKNELIFDLRPNLFYVPALIGMDLDGLYFSDFSISEQDVDSIRSYAPHKIVGLTGYDFESEHYPFIHNVSQTIKAIMLLKLGDSHIFDRILEEEDIIPFRRGDSMLLRNFLSKQELKTEINSLYDVLSLDEIRKVRTEVCDYLQKCKFLNLEERVYKIKDCVKTFGMLSRLPKFVEDKNSFSGYMMFYANNVEFVKENGEIADSVPIADYLRYRIANQFHDRLVSIDKKEQIVMQIFNGLNERIQQKNIREENKMSLDVLQEELLTKFGIVAPVHAYSFLKRFDNFGEFYIVKGIENNFIERTLKFGFK